MANESPSTYAFLPWTRSGLASLISSASRVSEARVQLAAAAQLDGASAGTLDLAILGPGDVTGFDKRAVIRTEPEANGQSFESNYLAAIEFDRPDLRLRPTASAFGY